VPTPKNFLPGCLEFRFQLKSFCKFHNAYLASRTDTQSDRQCVCSGPTLLLAESFAPPPVVCVSVSVGVLVFPVFGQQVSFALSASTPADKDNKGTGVLATVLTTFKLI